MTAVPLFDETEPPTLPTADAICRLLELRYPPPDWASFVEVRAGTGFANEQRLDFFTLHTWPSKGFRSIVCEVKITRRDFMRELSTPTKRQFAESVAHECYFVVPSGLLRPDEVPEGWGLMAVTRSGIQVKKAAQQRQPAAWPMSFIAMLLRRSVVPPEKTSKTLWTHAGQAVDEATLLRIAEEAFGRTLDDERARIARTAQAEALAAERPVWCDQVETAVRRAMGVYARPSMEAIETFLSGRLQAAISPDRRHQLRNARDVLNELLGEEAS